MPQHPLKQPVTIKAIGVTGFIDSINIDLQGTTYRVVYWLNGERRAEWLHPEEFHPPQPEGTA